MLRGLGVVAGVIVPGGRGSINGLQTIITKFNAIGLGVFGITNLGVHSIEGCLSKCQSFKFYLFESPYII
jgi:hypothetical protein